MKNCDILLIFAQNIDRGYTLEPVQTSTHDLCFRAKIGKNEYPYKPQFYNIKVGCKGVFITRTCYADAVSKQNGQLVDNTATHLYNIYFKTAHALRNLKK